MKNLNSMVLYSKNKEAVEKIISLTKEVEDLKEMLVKTCQLQEGDIVDVEYLTYKVDDAKTPVKKRVMVMKNTVDVWGRYNVRFYKIKKNGEASSQEEWFSDSTKLVSITPVSPIR